jgi:hypothetical protein
MFIGDTTDVLILNPGTRWCVCSTSHPGDLTELLRGISVQGKYLYIGVRHSFLESPGFHGAETFLRS